MDISGREEEEIERFFQRRTVHDESVDNEIRARVNDFSPVFYTSWEGILECFTLRRTKMNTRQSARRTYLSESVEKVQDPFPGFSSCVDLSSHSEFCSFVLNAIESTQPAKRRKRMTKKQAATKTEIVNLCKKVSASC